MKNIFKYLLFLGIISLSACSEDTIPTPEPEKPIVETPDPEDPGDDSGPLTLNVVGRFLKDDKGNIVNLHGFAQTYSPFFNDGKWNNFDVSGCLSYNKRMIDEIIAAGWKVNFVRMHMDPYWSDDRSKPEVRYEGHERFSETRFRKYLDEVFVPIAEYAIGKGLYVVFRPPGVAPKKIKVGDDYQEFLLVVWDIVSKHPKLKNNSCVMFELANEPVDIFWKPEGAEDKDGTYAGTGDGHFQNLNTYFQAITDKIRDNKAKNIIWIPGLAYQSSYSGYAKYPIKGENIGYAVHVYPGWYGSDAEEPSAELGGVMGGGYEGFQRGWNAQVKPVANFAPIMVTELDWAPAKYDSSWGKSITGIVGGTGFGANFKYIADKEGNVSWLIFTSCHLMADFKNVPGTPGSYTFLNDPEACPWPTYHWFREYAGEAPIEGELTKIELLNVDEDIEIRMGDSKNVIVKAFYEDGSSQVVTMKAKFTCNNTEVLRIEELGKLMALKEGEATVTVEYTSQQGVTKQLSFVARVITPFPLTKAMFDPSIYAGKDAEGKDTKGTFDETTRTLVTGQWGFGGWQYADGLNLTGYKTLTVELGNDAQGGVSFRLFDKTSYWTEPAMYNFGASRKVVVELDKMKDKNGATISPSHLYIIGFWSSGGVPIVIDKIYLN